MTDREEALKMARTRFADGLMAEYAADLMLEFGALEAERAARECYDIDDEGKFTERAAKLRKQKQS